MSTSTAHIKKTPKSRAKKRFVYRSSVTGKIVTKLFASKNPSTTYKDAIRPSIKDVVEMIKRASEFMNTGSIIMQRAIGKLAGLA